MEARVLEGDCIEAMRGMDEASVDAVVTDPPYGLEFMGKEWDNIGRNVGPGGKRRDRETAIAPRGDGWQPGSTYGAPAKNPRCEKCRRLRFDHEGRKCDCEMPAFKARASEYGEAMTAWHFDWVVEAWRVLKPGGHLLAFGGTRTYHRLACAIEDAGFEVRDCLAWLYGSGFPKSLDVSKAIDKAAGAERTEAIGPAYKVPNAKAVNPHFIQIAEQREDGDRTIDYAPTAPATPEAAQWRGWGTALKPAHEPIVLARKPLTGTVAGNVLAHGTGALNVDGCRIDGPKGDGNWKGRTDRKRGEDFAGFEGGWSDDEPGEQNAGGRWPANVILDPEAAALLDEQSGELRPATSRTKRERIGGTDRFLERTGDLKRDAVYDDGGGGASRFFYTAKASRAERNAGLPEGERSTHPTVKPIALMRWLCRLVTPPAGTILDPFAGSGTTGCAAVLEGFDFIGCEREAEYVEIARARIAFWEQYPGAEVEAVLASDAKRDRDQLDLLGGS